MHERRSARQMVLKKGIKLMGFYVRIATPPHICEAAKHPLTLPHDQQTTEKELPAIAFPPNVAGARTHTHAEKGATIRIQHIR